jgi:AraC-like DNA-binding protein
MPNNLPFRAFRPPANTDYQLEIISKTDELGNNARGTPAHRNGFMQMVWVVERSTVQHVGEEAYEVKAGQVLFVPENCAYYEADGSYDGHVFLFTNEFFTKEQAKIVARFSIFSLLSTQRLIDLNDVQSEKLLALLVGEYENHEMAFHAQFLQSLLFAALVKLENLHQQQHHQEAPIDMDGQVFNTFTNLLEANFRQRHDSQFYITALATTPKRLNAILVRVAGKTAVQLILDRLMVEAKRSLRFTNKSVKKIAFELGFEDAYYFTRLFKKKNGVSPKRFRDSLAQKV